MKLYAPDYYPDFACIADKCRHSCCIGWEIDIDADTYAYYKAIPGEFGARLRENITEDTQTPHFILGEKERCPFLNPSGLCDLITALGEDALCQICADHPRYRNFYDSCTEIGLGLCCEAAAELILMRDAKMRLVLLEDDGIVEQTNEAEEDFFAFRERVFVVLQNREAPIETRKAALWELLELREPSKAMAQWIAFYRELEVLDASWTARLLRYTENTYVVSESVQEQLLCYFVYRHLADGIYDGSLKSRVAFAVHATQFICALAENETDLLDVARMYSAEIEYSEENMEKILEEMQ